VIRFHFKGSPKHPKPIAFIGLSHNNLDALKRGRPIRVHAGDKLLGLGVELVIYSGTTEQAMTQELEDHEFIPKGTAERVRKAQRRGQEVVLRTNDSDSEPDQGDA
jgi:hypothetical protein